MRETEETQYQSWRFTYDAAISDDFRPEGVLGGGMIFHFVGALEFDGVLSFFPGHGVTAGVCDVLIGEIAKRLQEIKLRVVGIVFNLKKRNRSNHTYVYDFILPRIYRVAKKLIPKKKTTVNTKTTRTTINYYVCLH